MSSWGLLVATLLCSCELVTCFIGFSEQPSALFGCFAAAAVSLSVSGTTDSGKSTPMSLSSSSLLSLPSSSVYSSSTICTSSLSYCKTHSATSSLTSRDGPANHHSEPCRKSPIIFQLSKPNITSSLGSQSFGLPAASTSPSSSSSPLSSSPKSGFFAPITDTTCFSLPPSRSSSMVTPSGSVPSSSQPPASRIRARSLDPLDSSPSSPSSSTTITTTPRAAKPDTPPATTALSSPDLSSAHDNSSSSHKHSSATASSLAYDASVANSRPLMSSSSTRTSPLGCVGAGRLSSASTTTVAPTSSAAAPHRSGRRAFSESSKTVKLPLKRSLSTAAVLLASGSDSRPRVGPPLRALTTRTSRLDACSTVSLSEPPSARNLHTLVRSGGRSASANAPSATTDSVTAAVLLPLPMAARALRESTYKTRPSNAEPQQTQRSKTTDTTTTISQKNGLSRATGAWVDFDSSGPTTQVLVDIDDTIKSSGGFKLFNISFGGIDTQYARGEFYPGVFQFVLELAAYKLGRAVKPLPVAVLTARIPQFGIRKNSEVNQRLKEVARRRGIRDWGIDTDTKVLYSTLREWVFQSTRGDRKFENFVHLKGMMEAEQRSNTAQIRPAKALVEGASTKDFSLRIKTQPDSGASAQPRRSISTTVNRSTSNTNSNATTKPEGPETKLKYIWLGDTGEMDRQAGEMMAENFPNTVKAVFLHYVCENYRPGAPLPGDYGVNDVPIIFFRTYIGAARKAVLYNLMDKKGLARVFVEAVLELDRSGTESYSSKWKDLIKDIKDAEYFLELRESTVPEIQFAISIVRKHYSAILRKAQQQKQLKAAAPVLSAGQNPSGPP